MSDLDKKYVVNYYLMPLCDRPAMDVALVLKH